MAYVLTAMDLKALRSANDISVSLGRRGNQRVTVYKDNPKYNKDPFAERQLSYDLPATITANGKPRSCFASVSMYRNGGYGHAASAFDSLRVGDEISFHFSPDAGTNQYAANARIHIDYLYLYAVRGKQRLEFLIQVSACPENSARMCKEVPFSDFLLRDLAV